MDLYSMIEAGGHVKPELTGEDPAKFADCPIETAQETRAGEPARQPVEEVLQTTGKTVENAMPATPHYRHGQKPGILFRRRREGRNSSFCPTFRISSITGEARGGNNSYNNPRNGNGRHTPVLAATAAWQEQSRPLHGEYWHKTPVMSGYFVTFGEQV